MDLLRIIILAVVQGLTEFLPISSDGHLLIASALFEAATGHALGGKQLTLTIVLHAGTLVTVLVVFWKQIVRLASVDRRVVPLLIVGTIPVGVLGIILEKWFEPLLESPLAAGLGLIITGGVLLWMRRDETTAEHEADAGRRTYQELSYGQALLIGTFQAVAALPGISRSGSTIASGLRLTKLKRADAANFSFLLSVPAIGGVVFVKLLELLKEGTGSGFNVGELTVGAVVSCLVGFVALRWVLAWLRGGRLHLFAWWCIPLGIIVTAWQLLK
jgi:undecaprenyl-diphosphatase